MKKVEQYIMRKIKEDNCIHLSLIDPEETRPEDAAALTKSLEEYGTTAIMVGGSTIASSYLVDEVVKAIKDSVQIPVILFPNNVSGISQYADAIWFMSLINSNNPLFITGLQAMAAPTIKNYGIETIPLAYIVIGKESTAAYIGQAHSIPYEAAEIATNYALAAEYLGMHFVYLEAGSGAQKPVSSKMIDMVKNNISLPVIVGGGIRDHSSAEAIAKAGADAIVTGTILEDNKPEKNVREIIKALQRIKKHPK